MHYTLIFDASNKPFPWLFVSTGVFAAIICVFLLLLAHNARNATYYQQQRTMMILFAPIGIVCGFLWSGVAYTVTSSNAMMCQQAIRTGSYATIEGRVEQFQAGNNNRGSPPERFTINGVPFEYRDGVITCGYNQTSGNDGLLSEGMSIRVGYLPDQRNTIVRLEVADRYTATAVPRSLVE